MRTERTDFQGLRYFALRFPTFRKSAGKIIFTPTLLFWTAVHLFSGLTTYASEYNLPDPPGYLSFDKIPLRIIPVPNEKVPENCDSRFRQGLESEFRNVWAQCRKIGGLEPGSCQRILFERCVSAAKEIQKMESEACVAMAEEGSAIQSVLEVQSQKTAQASSADLNQKAYLATAKVIRGLEASEKALESRRALAEKSMKNPVCSLSSAGALYLSEEKKWGESILAARKHIQATIKQKKLASDQYARNSGKSVKELEGLASKNRMIPASAAVSLNNAAKANAETETKPLAASSIASPSFPQSNPPQANSVQGNPTQTNAIPPPVASSGSGIKWVPILAVGIPAAVLTALLISKNSRHRPESDDTPGPAPSPGVPEREDPVPQNTGDQDPIPNTASGSADLREWNIQVDPSFTDREKASVAVALAKIPSCYRYKLRNLFVKNQDLGPPERGRCTAGRFRFGGSTVWLNPRCAFGVGITVHEFFHVLGNRNFDELHGKWRPVSNANPNCPVSRYGAKNYYEDFAEAGRLGEAPDGSAEVRRPGACVDAKISGMQRMMRSCVRDN